MPQLPGRVILVTGASAGIGEATARRLVRGGATVVITARRQDRLDALARELDPAGARVLAVAGDITQDADRRRLVDAALARYGRIDALVNNAGYGTRGPVEIVSVDLLRRNFETNIFSLIALTQLGLAAWLSALIVALLTMGFGYVLMNTGLSRLRSTPMAPRQTMESLKENARWTTRQGA